MYKLKDLIIMFSISERTIRRHISNGKLTGTKVGGVWRFSEVNLQDYLDSDLMFDELKRKSNREIIDFMNDSRDINEKNACLIVDIKNLSVLNKTKIVMFTNKLSSPFNFTCIKHNLYYRFIITGNIENVSEFVNYINNI